MTVAFVILQYQTFELTRACINSILALDEAANARIVVVDNASPNGAGELIKNEYAAIPQVTVLKSPTNSGFSHGNNIGYKYASEHLQPDFIVTANSDIVFHQKNTISEILRIYQERPFYVLGPDILQYTLSEHQSPTRAHAFNKEEAEAELARIERTRRRIPINSLKKSLAAVLLSKNAYNALLKKRREKNRPHLSWNEPHEDACMFGACHIFSRDFIIASDSAYLPETHFYFEEDLLAKRCELNGWKTVYDPSLQVLHKESATVDAVNKAARKRDNVKLDNMAEALCVYIDYLKNSTKE